MFLYYDTETCGFHGPTVLIQYALDAEPIKIHDVWLSSVADTMDLIKWMLDYTNVGFNLSFDHFHLCQTYTTLSLLPQHAKPIDLVNQYVEAEEKARMLGCLKPKSALDLLLHARKGPYQNATMRRKPITVRRVPTAIAETLCAHLNASLKLPDIMFAGKKNKLERFVVQDSKDPNFKNIKLSFAPTIKLKALIHDIFDKDVTFLDEVMLATPNEVGYAPFAKALESGGWPAYIRYHVEHWRTNEKARRYAYDDVVYTRMLHRYFSALECVDRETAREFANTLDDTSYPLLEGGDMDSVLACMVGAVRWHGFKIDIDSMNQYRIEEAKKLQGLAFQHSAPASCMTYLHEVMEPVERAMVKNTDKETLNEISGWVHSETCEKCLGEGCGECNEGFKDTNERHAAAVRADEIKEARSVAKELELYAKLLTAGRFHASFKVIGTKSSRMSGSDGLNAQGIKHSDRVRRLFPLADDGYVLCAGDFDSFEVVLMDTTYHDPKLHALLVSGKKIHALFGEKLFPGHTYEEILATKALEGDKNLYDRSKRGVFGVGYGGTEHTLSRKCGVEEEVAKRAVQEWDEDYVEWGKARQKIFDMFCSMRQPKGIGTKVEWHEPADCIESMFGFKRYFTLENTVAKLLFDLANHPPKECRKMKGKVFRRDHEQTVEGATRTALFAAAFAIQAANMRAAANHVIQSAGADITKQLQVALWQFQPVGVADWRILPMNVHDEILAPMVPELVEPVRLTVNRFLESMKPQVPLISMSWKTHLESWAGK